MARGGQGSIRYQEGLYESSVVDPHWFYCGSGSSVLGQCGSGSRVYDPKFWHLIGEKIKFFLFEILIYWSRTLGLNEGRPSYRRNLQTSKKFTTRRDMKFFTFSFWVSFDLQDPDPHSQCGSGKNRPKPIRTRIHNTGWRPWSPGEHLPGLTAL